MSMSRELLSLACNNNYLTQFRYLAGNIIEYDIKQANINMLYKYGLINQNRYEYLSSLPKYNREVIVGKMIRENKEYYKAINNGIKEAKKLLFNSNNIQEFEVVRIANDAVYVNRMNNLNFTKFDNIEFVQKSVSTNYLNLNKILFFINFNSQNGISVDVKGLGDDYNIHEPMISIIVNIISSLQFDSIKNTMIMLDNFIDDYLNLKLDVGYYRELNSDAMYRVIGGKFSIYNLGEISKDIDINYNLYILRELSSIIYEIYTGIYRKL